MVTCGVVRFCDFVSTDLLLFYWFWLEIKIEVKLQRSNWNDLFWLLVLLTTVSRRILCERGIITDLFGHLK